MLIAITKNAIPKKAITKTTGIHSGENTHHHDQSILSANFNPKNNRNNNSKNSVPVFKSTFTSFIFFSFSIILAQLKTKHTGFLLGLPSIQVLSIYCKLLVYRQSLLELHNKVQCFPCKFLLLLLRHHEHLPFFA